MKILGTDRGASALMRGVSVPLIALGGCLALSLTALPSGVGVAGPTTGPGDRMDRPETVAVSLPSGTSGTGSGGVVPTETVSIPRTIAFSEGRRLALLPWGQAPGQVGVDTPKEGLARGPEALAVAEDGRIVVLDSVNRRLVLLDAEGRFDRTIDLWLREPRFLAVTRDALSVLDADADRQVVTYDWAGHEVTAVEVPQFDDPVTGLFVEQIGLSVETGHSECHRIVTADIRQTRDTMDSLSGRPAPWNKSRRIKGTFRPGTAPRATVSVLSITRVPSRDRIEKAVELALGCPIEFLISVDGDTQGAVVLGARPLKPVGESAGPSADPLSSSVLIARLARTGPAAQAGARGSDADPSTTTVSALLLAESSYAYVGQPYVCGTDGRVYQPWPSEQGYSIFVHDFAGGGA